MTTVRDILEAIDRLAPFRLAEAWDNVGLLLGDPGARVRRVLVALDVTRAVCDEAETVGAEVVLAHHPLLFQPVGRLTRETVRGRLALRLARADRAVIAAHTNLDSAPGGLCDLLAGMVGLTDTEPLQPAPPMPQDTGQAPAGLGRVGPIKDSRTLGDLADKTREALGCESIRLAGDPAAPLQRAAAVTGSGGGMAQALRRAGADACVTGEMTYHDLSDLAAAGTGVILGGHWRTEHATLAAWTPRLAEAAEVEVRLSQRERDPTAWR